MNSHANERQSQCQCLPFSGNSPGGRNERIAKHPAATSAGERSPQRLRQGSREFRPVTPFSNTGTHLHPARSASRFLASIDMPTDLAFTNEQYEASSPRSCPPHGPRAWNRSKMLLSTLSKRQRRPQASTRASSPAAPRRRCSLLAFLSWMMKARNYQDVGVCGYHDGGSLPGIDREVAEREIKEAKHENRVEGRSFCFRFEFLVIGAASGNRPIYFSIFVFHSVGCNVDHYDLHFSILQVCCLVVGGLQRAAHQAAAKPPATYQGQRVPIPRI